MFIHPCFAQIDDLNDVPDVFQMYNIVFISKWVEYYTLGLLYILVFKMFVANACWLNFYNCI